MRNEKKMETDIITLQALVGCAVELNKFDHVSVYLCIQGNTDCICLTVEENKTSAYQSRAFLGEQEKIQRMRADMETMLGVKERTR